MVQERKALKAQLETLRNAERILTRDPEITSMIGASDDDLLYELRAESAEEKLGKKRGGEVSSPSHSEPSPTAAHKVEESKSIPPAVPLAQTAPHQDGKATGKISEGRKSPTMPAGGASPSGKNPKEVKAVVNLFGKK